MKVSYLWILESAGFHWDMMSYRCIDVWCQNFNFGGLFQMVSEHYDPWKLTV